MDIKTVEYSNGVFINCAFDDEYLPLLRAIIFCVYRCGFSPITALSQDNSLDNRLSKIEKCIEACRYGIHDISRIELTSNKLPRFNMPFELGIFFGARRFGNSLQKTKTAIIFDTDRYRYQQFISDLNGVDIKAHNNDINIAIKLVRDWLHISSMRKTIPGHMIIQQEYLLFNSNLPEVVKVTGLEMNSLSFNDFCLIVEEAMRKFIEK